MIRHRSTLDMRQAECFIGQFVTDLGAAVHAGWSSWGEVGALQGPRRGPMSSATTAAKTKTDERYLRELAASQAAGATVTYNDRSRQVQSDEEASFNGWAKRRQPPHMLLGI